MNRGSPEFAAVLSIRKPTHSPHVSMRSLPPNHQQEDTKIVREQSKEDQHKREGVDAITFVFIPHLCEVGKASLNDATNNHAHEHPSAQHQQTVEQHTYQGHTDSTRNQSNEVCYAEVRAKVINDYPNAYTGPASFGLLEETKRKKQKNVKIKLKPQQFCTPVDRLKFCGNCWFLV